jgi:hypothetical protein
MQKEGGIKTGGEGVPRQAGLNGIHYYYRGMFFRQSHLNRSNF